MSYILEALRKSQQDRELGRVPTLATQPLFTPRETGRNSWIGIALGLAALAVAIALYAVLRAGPETAPGGAASAHPAAQPSTQPLTQPPAQVAATAMVPPAAGFTPDGAVVRPETTAPAYFPGVAPTAATPVATIGQPAVPSPAATLGQAGVASPTARVEQSQVVPGSEAGAAGQAAPPAAARVPEEAPGDLAVPPHAPYVGGPSEPEPGYPPPAPPARGSTRSSPADAIPEDLREDIEAFKDQIKGGQGGKSASKAKASAAQQQVPLRERRLPPEVQERLPSFLLTVHLYDADPEKRLVIIDGRRLRQGDATRSGILVEEIFPDGVALAFEGHRFFQPR